MSNIDCSVPPRQRMPPTRSPYGQPIEETLGRTSRNRSWDLFPRDHPQWNGMGYGGRPKNLVRLRYRPGTCTVYYSALIHTPLLRLCRSCRKHSVPRSCFESTMKALPAPCYELVSFSLCMTVLSGLQAKCFSRVGWEGDSGKKRSCSTPE